MQPRKAQKGKMPLAALVSALALSLAGCVLTAVPRAPISPEVFRLAASNDRAIRLDLSGPQETLSVGHQYLFIVIPFGRIVIEHPLDHLRTSAYTQASLSGLRPIVDVPANDSAFDTPRLEIRLQDIQVSAFDFLFTRHIVCDVSVEARLFAPGSSSPEKLAAGRVAETEFVRYAFEPELQRVFLRAMDGALHEAISQLVVVR